jgi:hypothetical protein
MAPKSAAFVTAQELWDAGMTRHEARMMLQLKYDRIMSKSRISQLLAHYWGPEANESSMKASAAPTKRKSDAVSKDKESTKSPTKSDSTDSSMARTRAKLNSAK